MVIVVLVVTIGCDSSLGTKQLREQWEKDFYNTCMLPVLQDIQKHLRKALDLIANDDSQGKIKTCSIFNYSCHI